MSKVDVTCDRCNKAIHGAIDETFTAGFYRRSGHSVIPNGWNILFNDGEQDVCDECMQKDERYKRLYANG